MTSTPRLPSRITDAEVSRLPLTAARAELLEDIVKQQTPAPRSDLDRPARPRRTTRWAVGLAAAVAVAAVAVTPQLLGGDTLPTAAGPSATPSPSTATGPSPTPGPVTPTVVARHTGDNPVLEAPGWTLDNAYESTDGGEFSWSRDGASLEVTWYPAAQHDSYYADRDHELPVVARVDFLGLDSPVWRYSRTDHATIRPAQDGRFVEVRGDGMPLDDFRALVAQVSLVDPADQAAAMPGAVSADDALPTLLGMLSDIDAPPGFDPDSVRLSGINSRYQVGAPLTGAVTCAWLASYGAAQAAGDQAGVRAAQQAMAGSRDWAILREMDTTGDWPESIWDVADRMAAGDPAASIEESVGDMCG